MNNKLCDVAILAGGKGTRLKSRTGNVPKPMALLLGKPILEHQIELCKKQGFLNIALLVCYEHEFISEYFKDGLKFGVNITYVIENQPRGTAGALSDALDIFSDNFLVLYGDTYLDVDLNLFLDFHFKVKSEISLMIHPNDHPVDSDLVEINDKSRVIDIHPYPHPLNTYLPNLVNAALYVINRNIFKGEVPTSGKFDLAKHTFPDLICKGVKVFGYVSQEYIKDMGTPERIDKVERDIIFGLPEMLSTRQFRSAIFLDRDGTINEEINHLSKPEQLRLIKGAGHAIRKINRKGFLSVVITNQPVIARGDLTLDGLKKIHNKLHFELALSGAYLDKIYICPHHPDNGFPNEIPELKIACNCRKPKTGLIDQAVKELKIDRTKSWFIGDTSSDMLAANNAGLKTVLVRTGYAGYDLKYNIKPDFILPDIDNAVDFIFNDYFMLKEKLKPIVSLSSESRLILIGGLARVGKSFMAQVLAELLMQIGKKVHVISIDGWLKPIETRDEGKGVLNRYNMSEVQKIIKLCIDNPSSIDLIIPEYDRLNRTCNKYKSISVGPSDIIIIEGVPALMDSYLCSKSRVRLFIDIDEAEREKRLLSDYNWRKMKSELVQKNLDSRKLDELPNVRKSSSNSTHKFLN